MKHPRIAIVALALIAVTACKNNAKETEETNATEEIKTSTISIAPLAESPAYADAKLLLDASDTMVVEEAGEVNFSFAVENYVLGDQTNSPNAEKLANSGKGQHIHFILNNQPYSAHYEAQVKKEIPEGVHHLVAFLSRSYHESVKNDHSVIVRKLVVGANGENASELDLNAPTLIYSRPKGEYVGKDTENLLLDFFVLNTELSENGNKVIATINGEAFTITQWAPQVITGLPKGELTVKLELVDAEGNLIPGPFNTVERKVMLKE